MGTRASAGVSTGVVTFLFTDLVGSTRTLTRLGDDAAEELRRAHFALLRTAVGDAGGEEVKNLGDGLMVAFASPLDALGAAVAIQRAIAAHNRARPDRSLGVRVGLHVGEPVRDGNDFFGTAVVVAKRLCDAAQGGQILASDLVAGLVGSRGGFELRSVGSLELKGLDTPLPAVDVAWKPTGEPARPVSSRRRVGAGHGPTLVGRDAEMALLDDDLESAWDPRRLYTLEARMESWDRAIRHRVTGPRSTRRRSGTRRS